MPREDSFLAPYFLGPSAENDVTHRVLPLNSEGFGRLLKETIKSCEYFWDTSHEMRERLSDRVHLNVPFEPDSNLICLVINPQGNESLAAMNRFGRRVFESMKVDADQPVQLKTFIGSHTSISGRPASRRAEKLH